MEQQDGAALVEAVEVRGVPVLRVSGDLDMGTVDAVRQEVLVWLDTTTSASVIDLSAVRFLASHGLALLVEATQHAERCGTTFVLVAGHRAVLRPLQATGLIPVFTIHSDVDRAVAEVRGAAPASPPPSLD
ncbi:anti-sigma factor antagonist [Saccharothrix texasensis]|uniref:Anti-sigma factor antagonist n=1 Tax=Saccharothrix texasensis TaxID=103734 RepID=A0A3N1HH30_9PSEU|nr:anti-sigma factor antagonist [Saccharothrix texasensis]ROP41807.1 anti-anti-sigma factor [Saccharothrix texasensis]